MEENISMLHQVGLYVSQILQMIIRRSTFFFKLKAARFPENLGDEAQNLRCFLH